MSAGKLTTPVCPPEGWFENPPPKHCGTCQAMIEAGIVNDSYDDWLRARGEQPVPR
jgi:hypothetical protein